MSAKKRKYFSSSIHDLRDVCNEHKSNKDILSEVYNELTFRKTRGAVELRNKLEAYLKEDIPSTPPPSEPSPDATKTKSTQVKAKPKVKPKDSVGYDEPQFSYQHDFSLIDSNEESTCQNSKWQIKLREDTKYLLSADKDGDLLDKQIEALEKFIDELKNTGKSNTFITLTNGKKIQESSVNLYKFILEDAIELFEGASVQITIANNESTAKVASLLDGAVILEFDNDYGSKIDSCTVKVDKTQLLRSLNEKLIKVRAGDVEGFNFELAEKVFFNDGEQKQPELEKNVILGSGNQVLNKEQKQAVCSVLTNENSYIWGPPGTGKTFTLGILIENFFSKEERSLIVSNTNQAVDQVLLKLCKVLGKEHKAVKEGFILRRGKIDLSELESDWGEYIDLDSVVEKKSKKLKEKESKLETKIGKLNKKSKGFEDIINKFKLRDEKKLLLTQSKQELDTLEADKRNLASNNKILINDRDALLRELDSFNSAGAIRRIVMRSKIDIENDIDRNERRQEEIKNKEKTLPNLIKSKKDEVNNIKSDIDLISTELQKQDRAKCEQEVQKIEKELGPLEMELAEVRREIEGIKQKVLDDAKIIGATVTKTFLKKEEFLNFDNVVVDEASMVILPALYNVAGLASKRCVISGDFRQIPPIIETKQKGIFEEIGKGIFEKSGIEEVCRTSKSAPNLVMLKQQYRMREEICSLINSFMYQGKLVTSKTKIDESNFSIIPEINKNIVLIDTSKIFPFAQKKGTSYYNLMHAIATRNLVNIISAEPELSGKSIGISAPYSAQAKMHAAINKSNSSVTAGTVHRFQGDEKDIMIVDTVDSLGDAQVGFWAMADHPNEDGCKLWNVGISRAKDYLFFIGNLTHLNRHLPKPSFLRNVLHNAQQKGQVIEVEEILKLDKLKEDLQSLQKTFELDDETLEKGLFNNRDFEKVFIEDLKKAKKTIAIFSGFITPARVATYGDIFRQKIAEDVKIRCVTRPPDRNGSMKPELGKQALDSLEAIGCIVDTRVSIHQKAAIIDDTVSWFGSLNPLSHTSLTEETMARIDNKGFALQLSQNLSIKFVKDVEGASVVKENPECESCGYQRTAFNFGTYGRPDYWRCESCSHITSVIQNKYGKKIKDTSFVGKECPEKCGGTLVIKNGRYGQFYSCNNYPKCKATLKV
jgi:superfamily I DNA and/or RNA helicase